MPTIKHGSIVNKTDFCSRNSLKIAGTADFLKLYFIFFHEILHTDAKWQFPAFSAGKKFFSKIGLGHVLSIPNTHLCAKNQKKLMIKSRENARKPVFPVYFRHFRPEIFFFLKIGLRHFLDIAILHLCAKNQKKIMSLSREKLVTDRRTN